MRIIPNLMLLCSCASLKEIKIKKACADSARSDKTIPASSRRLLNCCLSLSGLSCCHREGAGKFSTPMCQDPPLIPWIRARVFLSSSQGYVRSELKCKESMKPVTLHWVMQRKPLKTAMNYLCCVLLKVRTSRVRIWRQVVSYELTHSVSSGSCLSEKRGLFFPVQSKLIKPLPCLQSLFGMLYFVMVFLCIWFFWNPLLLKRWAGLKIGSPHRLREKKKGQKYNSRWKWSCFEKFWCFKAV